MTATALSHAPIPTTAARPALPPTRGQRVRAALRAAGRTVVDNLATDSGWCWAYGAWYPAIDPTYWPRGRR